MSRTIANFFGNVDGGEFAQKDVLFMVTRPNRVLHFSSRILLRHTSLLCSDSLSLWGRFIAGHACKHTRAFSLLSNTRESVCKSYMDLQ